MHHLDGAHQSPAHRLKKINTVSAFYLTQFRRPITKSQPIECYGYAVALPYGPAPPNYMKNGNTEHCEPPKTLYKRKTVAHFWVKFVSAIFLAKTILCAFFCVITFTVSSCNGKWRGLVWRMRRGKSIISYQIGCV